MHTYVKGDAIYDGKDYGPIFGNGNDLRVASNSNSNTNSYTNLGYSYSLPNGFTNANAEKFTPIAKANF